MTDRIWKGMVTCFNESTMYEVIEKLRHRILRAEIRVSDMPTSLVNELDGMANVSINVTAIEKKRRIEK